MKDKNTKCCGDGCKDNCDSEPCCDDNCGKDCCSEPCCGNGSSNEPCCDKKKISGCGACNGGVYGLAFVGAVIYYIQHAETFWMGAIGFLKALVWPAILIYKLLELLAK